MSASHRHKDTNKSSHDGGRDRHFQENRGRDRPRNDLASRNNEDRNREKENRERTEEHARREERSEKRNKEKENDRKKERENERDRNNDSEKNRDDELHRFTKDRAKERNRERESETDRTRDRNRENNRDKERSSRSQDHTRERNRGKGQRDGNRERNYRDQRLRDQRKSLVNDRSALRGIKRERDWREGTREQMDWRNKRHRESRGGRRGPSRPSDPLSVPRSAAFFEHDDRANPFPELSRWSRQSRDRIQGKWQHDKYEETRREDQVSSPVLRHDRQDGQQSSSTLEETPALTAREGQDDDEPEAHPNEEVSNQKERITDLQTQETKTESLLDELV
jgi:ATP-dependent RNA helicase DDX46/PRP5